MDFADLDLRAASERGSWVHLKLRGELMFADSHEKEPTKPCRLLIKGIGSEAVMESIQKVDRIEALRVQRLERTPEREKDAVLARSQRDLEAAMADMIVGAVTGWENIIFKGKEMPFSAENVLTICGPRTLFFGQVTDAIREEQRLFTDADSA